MISNKFLRASIYHAINFQLKHSINSPYHVPTVTQLLISNVAEIPPYYNLHYMNSDELKILVSCFSYHIILRSNLVGCIATKRGQKKNTLKIKLKQKKPFSSNVTHYIPDDYIFYIQTLGDQQIRRLIPI